METQKNTSKHSLQDIQTHFGISRSKLYKTLKEQGIKATKEGRKSYISNTDLTQLENVLKNTGTNTQKNTGTNTGTKNTDLIDHLQAQIKEEQEKNNQLLTENKELMREVGQWQGVAKTLEQQNQKLLSARPTEEKIEIEEAEIIKEEQNTDKVEIIETKPKKKGWFSFFRKQKN